MTKEIDAAIEALEQSIDALEYLEIESDAIPVDLLALHDQNQSALAGLRSLKREPTPMLTEKQRRYILDLALDLEKTGRIVSLSEGQERSDMVARNRNIQCALEDYLRNLTAQEAKQEPVAWSYESAKAFALQEANKLLDAALLKTYPQGCDNGEVFDLWNKARAAIAKLKEVRPTPQQEADQKAWEWQNQHHIRRQFEDDDFQPGAI